MRMINSSYIAFVTALLSVVCIPILRGNPPSWWTERGVIQVGASADDYYVVNQGQVRNMAKQAYNEMNELLPGGAGPILDAIWSDSGTLGNPANGADDYKAVNIGQLKNVAKPFYDRMIELGVIREYPWDGAEIVDDYSLANIGQVKQLFALQFSSGGFFDMDMDGVSDSWENAYFGSTSAYTPQEFQEDYNNDGISSIQEATNGIDPFCAEYSLGKISLNMQFHLDATMDMTTADDYLVSWIDQSSRHVSMQNTGGNKAKVVYYGTNDRPAVRLYSTYSYLQGNMDVSESWPAYSFLLVLRPNVRGQRAILGGGCGSGIGLEEQNVGGTGDTAPDGRSIASGYMTSGVDPSGLTLRMKPRVWGGELPTDLYEIGLWEVLVFTYDNGRGILYKNGIQVAEKQNMGAAGPWGMLKLGSDNETSAASDYIKVCVYDRALTLQEVEILADDVERQNGVLSDRDSDGLLDMWEFKQYGTLMTVNGQSDLSAISVDIEIPANSGTY